jgi:hypothetical protein
MSPPPTTNAAMSRMVMTMWRMVRGLLRPVGRSNVDPTADTIALAHGANVEAPWRLAGGQSFES